jgi:hypothetical protein
VDASDCRRLFQEVDLEKDATVGAVGECRWVELGVEVARDVLAAGGSRDQMWAAVWVYGTSGTDPAALRPMLAYDEPSISTMAAGALLPLGDRDALELLGAAVSDTDILLGSRPPTTISAYAQYILGRFVIADDTPARLGIAPDDSADAWLAWLERHGDALVYDPTTGEWSPR